MADRENGFTIEDILTCLDENYDIPGDGADSDISGVEDEVDEIDFMMENVNNSVDNNNNGACCFDDIHQVDVIDVERPSNLAGRLPIFDFSDVEWSKTTKEPESVSKVRGQFNKEVGATHILPETASAFDFLKSIFSMNVIHQIILETNRYATQQFIASGKGPEKWEKLTDVEFLAFLGILVAMGLKRVSCLRDCWSQDWVFGIPALARVMPLMRFRDILRYLHLNDNTKMLPRDDPDYDKLFKVRPFIDAIKANFKLQYKLHEEISVDEAMIRFKGRTTLKQYMPNKPVKRGFKMWCLADSRSGYLWDFDIYSGKNSDAVEYGLGYNVVTKLCEEVYGKWHKVFFDNFFTSVDLCQDLFSNKMLSCGTVRPNRRGLPKELFDKSNLKKMSRGDIAEMRKGPLLAITWLDNKAVHVVSTLPQPETPTVEVKRRKKDGAHESVPCPMAIREYNMYMGGVDKNDQLKSYYEITVNSKKWWPRIFYDLIDRCIINSYILECESPNHRRRPLKEFRGDLVKQLIGNFSSRKVTGRRSLQLPSRFTERHFPSCLPTNENGKKMQRRCGICSKKPTYWCAECGVGLCPAPCFGQYHTKS